MRWGLDELAEQDICDDADTTISATSKYASADSCIDPKCDGLHGQKQLPASKRKACRDEYAELEKARHLLMAFWRNVFLWADEGRLPTSVADPDDVVMLQGVWLYRADRFRTVVEPLEILLNGLWLHGRYARAYWPHDSPYELTVQPVLRARSKLFGKIERQWLVQQWRDQQNHLASRSISAVAVDVSGVTQATTLQFSVNVCSLSVSASHQVCIVTCMGAAGIHAFIDERAACFQVPTTV